MTEEERKRKNNVSNNNFLSYIYKGLSKIRRDKESIKSVIIITYHKSISNYVKLLAPPKNESKTNLL